MKDSDRPREAAVRKGASGLGRGSGQWCRSAMERPKWLLRLVVLSLFCFVLFFFFLIQIATSNRTLTVSKDGENG